MTNYNININRPPISPEEIQGKKDFASLIKQHQAIHRPWYKKPWVGGTAGIAIVATLIVSYFMIVNKLAKKSHENEGISIQSSRFKEKHEDASQNKEAVIKPALNNINVAFASYTVDCNSATEIKYKTGSLISIPANAFMDEKGNTISGKVDIRYREFHDPVDFMLSGIPMTYDSAGKQYLFESAGMMQIEGYQNGVPVKIKPDKKISVKMVSGQQGNKYNLYSLDTVKGAWTCLGKDKILEEKNKKTGKRKPINVFEDNEINSNRSSNWVVNGKELKISNSQPIVYKEFDLVKEPINGTTNTNALADSAKIIKSLASIKPIKPEKADKKAKQFMLDVDTSEFPELAIYKNVKFQLYGDKAETFWADSEKKKSKTNTAKNNTSKKKVAKLEGDEVFLKGKERRQRLKEKNARLNKKGDTGVVNIKVLDGEYDDSDPNNNTLANITWNDARLTKGDKNYILTLGAGNKKMALPVVPVFEEKDYPTAIKEYDKKYAEYQAKLKERLASEEEARKERETSLELARLDREQRYKQYQQSRLDQIKKQDSLAMARNKWDDRGIQMNSQLYRCFEVSGFGIYNCDHGFDFPTKSAIIKLMDDKKQEYKCSTYYMLYLNRNSMMQYSPGAPVRYNPQGQNVLCGVTSEGELVRASSECFTEAKHKSNMTIQAESIGKKADIESIKSFIMPGK